MHVHNISPDSSPMLQYTNIIHIIRTAELSVRYAYWVFKFDRVHCGYIGGGLVKNHGY